MQSDLRSDEDMSFMTYSELQFCFYHCNKPHEEHPQLERKCMSVSVEGNSFLEETAFQHWAVILVYVSGPSFSLNLRKLDCIHNTRMAFCASSVSSLPIKVAEIPTRTAGWSPPYTNKQDPRPFMITHAHSAMSEFNYCWFRKLIVSYLQ